MRLQDLRDELAAGGWGPTPLAWLLARRVADLFTEEPNGNIILSPRGFDVLTEDCYEGADVEQSLVRYLFGEEKP